MVTRNSNSVIYNINVIDKLIFQTLKQSSNRPKDIIVNFDKGINYELPLDIMLKVLTLMNIEQLKQIGLETIVLFDTVAGEVSEYTI